MEAWRYFEINVLQQISHTDVLDQLLDVLVYAVGNSDLQRSLCDIWSLS